MKIKIIAAQAGTGQGAKGPYQFVKVTYTNLTFQNKTESKQIMPFGATKDAYNTLVSAKADDVYEITVVKNASGYNDWTRVVPSTEDGSEQQAGRTQGSATPVAAGPASRGFETPEERAKKQVYIVRQSSLSNAIDTLSVGAKSAPSAEAVIALAQRYEAYVFDTNVPTADTLPPDIE